MGVVLRKSGRGFKHFAVIWNPPSRNPESATGVYTWGGFTLQLDGVLLFNETYVNYSHAYKLQRISFRGIYTI
jgi:hypothetical protein